MSNIFDQIKTNLKDELSQIDQVIINSSKGKADLIAEISQHLVLSGGKRIRPILTILCAKLCGYKSGTRHCNLGAAVELIHSATLLHDDVVDDSKMRRNQKTSNAIWGNKASILVGDYLLSVAFQLMVADGSLKVLDLLSRCSSIMSDGEVIQLTNSHDINISQEKYLEIISYKTAILFSASCKVGGLICEVDETKQQNLNNFGNNLGISFQIIDDILDYDATLENLGKDIGNDFYEGKITLPIIITRTLANEFDNKEIEKIFAENLLNPEQKNQENFKKIMNLIEKYDTLNKSKLVAVEFYNQAKKNLQNFPDCLEKEMLINILEYSISRKK